MPPAAVNSKMAFKIKKEFQSINDRKQFMMNGKALKTKNMLQRLLTETNGISIHSAPQKALRSILSTRNY